MAIQLHDFHFVEGDPQLQNFPVSLKSELIEHCTREGSVNLPGMRKYKRPSTLFKSKRGEPCFYRSKVTGDDLRAAQFRYGLDHEVWVFQEKREHGINNGKAFIGAIVSGSAQTKRSLSDGQKSYTMTCKVWNHLTGWIGESQTDVRMQRLVATGDDDSSNESADTFPDIANILNGNSENEFGQRRRKRSSISESPSTGHSPVENSRAGSRRQSRLNATKRIKRCLRYSSEMDDTIFVATPQNSTIRLPRSGTNETNSTLDAPGPASRESYDNQKIVRTPSVFVSTEETVVKPKLKVVFKFTPKGQVLRTKPLGICDTVSKIFAQAQIAGIIDGRDALLVVQTRTDEWRWLARGDNEDFSEIYQIVVENDHLEQIVVLKGSD